MAKVISIKDFLEAKDVRYAAFDLTPWGIDGELKLGSLSAGDLLEWTEANEPLAEDAKPEEKKAQKERRRVAMIMLLAKSLCNEDGSRAADADELIKALQKRDHKLVNDAVGKVLELNELGKKKQEAAKNA